MTSWKKGLLPLHKDAEPLDLLWNLILTSHSGKVSWKNWNIPPAELKMGTRSKAFSDGVKKLSH